MYEIYLVIEGTALKRALTIRLWCKLPHTQLFLCMPVDTLP